MKKYIAFALILCLFCSLPMQAVADTSVVSALGIVGDILGIGIDLIGDSATQSKIDTINNKLENNIAVTSDEISGILESLQNLSYNGSGALMKSFSGIARNNYSLSWGTHRISAETSDFSYFCWVDNVLFCCALDKKESYKVTLEADGSSYEYSGGDAAGTSYGTLYYQYVGYKPTETYGYHVTDYQNTPVGVFDSFQDVAKAIYSSRRTVANYSSVLQNYENGYTGVKISGSYKADGKTLADYDYDWEAFLKAHGMTVLSVNPDGQTVNNYNYGKEPETESPTETPSFPDNFQPEDFQPEDYKINLKDKFPFCLPYDAYKFLSCLAAEPQAPEFTWVIPLETFGLENYEVELDFSAFDSAAGILRMMELFAFCVSLAFAGKKMIVGG